MRFFILSCIIYGYALVPSTAYARQTKEQPGFLDNGGAACIGLAIGGSLALLLQHKEVVMDFIEDQIGLDQFPDYAWMSLFFATISPTCSYITYYAYQKYKKFYEKKHHSHLPT